MPAPRTPRLEEIIRTAVIDVSEGSASSSLEPDLFLIGLLAPPEHFIARHGDVGREEAQAGDGDHTLPRLYVGGVPVQVR